ncbi:hypothetical protein PH5382_02388 [Phaeobacter sp. CECT 5382]|nr:hypothetical protein [Phaeobacter sp. CECT 5382]CUH88452.1 hypothetical protein PH5382_02388 [Phaeobacter sp. CECT 5382]
MHIQHIESERGVGLLLRLNWDRALAAAIVFVSLSLGAWLAGL